MKITCLQENLKTSLNLVQNIVGKNLTLPILNNTLLETESGRLKISTTNLEIGITCWTPGKIEKEGKITIPAKILSNFINNIPNKKIELDVKNNILNIKCENYKATLKGLPADEFPIIPKIKEKPQIKIDGNILKNSLNQVAGMAAISESRPEISGILFKVEKNALKFVATDSFRLVEKNINKLNEVSKDNFEFIIPQRTSQELIRILSEKEESEVKIALGLNQILFDLSDLQLVSRLIDGQYPDYKQIIPQDILFSAILNRDEFFNIIRVAGIFSSKINDIRINLNFQKNIIEVLSSDPDLGENKSQINADFSTKEKRKDLEINFNYRYILEGLNNIQTKKILFGVNSESMPAIIKPIGEEGYLYLVMPIRTT